MTGGSPTGAPRGAEHGPLDLTLLGVGAMNSPRYAPAGLLIEFAGQRVAIDGGPGAEPTGPIDAWLVTDEHAELIAALRRLAARQELRPEVAAYERGRLSVSPHPVRHTAHPTFGYLVEVGSRRVAWAPEFWELPSWVEGVDLLFADAAGWDRPIRFRGGVGGHAAALAVCEQARAAGVRRLVFAHIGRPTVRAIERGETLPFGEFGHDGEHFTLDGSSH